MNVLQYRINITIHGIDGTLITSPCFPRLTALSERESVCRMSNMVLSTRPLHNKWGKLRRDKLLLKLLDVNLHSKQFVKESSD